MAKTSTKEVNMAMLLVQPGPVLARCGAHPDEAQAECGTCGAWAASVVVGFTHSAWPAEWARPSSSEFIEAERALGGVHTDDAPGDRQ
jgi:hypothetical protein